ncbi:MAG: pyridoxal phosphate-dependent aminotransferase, partial [Coxiellaceae bacterium]|nr:pyridoxal phosphate-dependent aminotransferase [Coxiellaceae bacterium]
MSDQLSNRINQIKPSATMAVNAKATKLRQEGRNIINLSVGEPDFDTPEFIKEAAIKAIHDGHTKYTAADGIPELKTAIINKLKNDNDLDYTPQQIMVSDGLKQVFYNLTQALLNEGDEVIIPAPYWVSYPDMVKLTGAKPVIVNCTEENRLKISPKQLENAITDKTKLFILNSPNNPTGMAYTLEELKALGEVLKKHPNIVIASDDIYEYILWGMDHYVNILNACPELKDRTVVGNGLSTAYAMTGWRIGYAAAPEHIISGMNKVQSQSTTCSNSIAQYASVAALNGGRDF